VTPGLVSGFASVLKHETPPTGSEALHGDALHAVFVHLVRALATEKPVLWVTDDLHFAEPDSRAIFASMARAIDDHRVLLLGTTRPDILEEEVAHLGRMGNFQRLSLGRLGARQVIELLRDAFRSAELAERLGGKIAYKSDGVPFFVFEMIRGLVEGRFLTVAPDGSYVENQRIDEIQVPSAVRDLIEARLSDLSREERALIDVGAVQGFEFDPDLSARVREMKRFQVLETLADLERRTGIIRSGPGPYRFDHHQIQEVILDGLPPDLRREYHALLADAFRDRERIPEDPEPGVPGEAARFLAVHHFRGSRPAEGLPWMRPALAHLERGYRNDAAVELAGLCLAREGLLEGPERVEILLKKAGYLGVLGRRREERRALDEALALIEESDDDLAKATVSSGLGAHFLRVAEYELARNRFEEAKALARRAGDRTEEAHAANNLGLVFRSLGLYDLAREQLEQCVTISREIGDRRGEAYAIGNLGGVCMAVGRYDEAAEHYGLCLEISREIGDRRGTARATGNLGAVHNTIGNYEEAMRHHEASLGIAREIGDRQGEAYATLRLGNVLQSFGRYEEARVQCARCLEISREMGDRRGEGVSAGNLGTVLRSLGLYEEARERLQESLEVSREIGFRQGEAFALVTLGGIHASLGDAARARGEFESALRLSEEIGDRSFRGESMAGLAMLAEWAGDLEEAERLLRECLTLLREATLPPQTGRTLVALGRCVVAAGRREESRPLLDEALGIGRDLDDPGIMIPADVLLAGLPGGDPEAAERDLREYEPRLAVAARMEARLGLWRVTGDLAHLETAYDSLSHLRDHAPRDFRYLLLENVPLHREVVSAWQSAAKR
jgi:tetratricopeptide (TPR) repeat protein